jgi:hypothetical protein
MYRGAKCKYSRVALKSVGGNIIGENLFLGVTQFWGEAAAIARGVNERTIFQRE